MAEVDVTVVGLGAMGMPIARNLLAAGFKVAAWNRDRTRIAELVDSGASEVHDLADVFESRIVVSVLADDAAVRGMFLDSGVLATAGEGAVHVNLATISPHLAAEAADTHAQHGVGYVAAPMFGGVPVAVAGKLNIITAGDADLVAQVRPFLEAISAKLWPVGDEPHLANVVKVSGQLLIASAIQTLAEAVTLAERGGIDARTLVDLFTSTITPGPVYSSYGALIAESDYEPARFTALLGLKDVELARAQAASSGLRLPVGDLLSALLAEAIDGGHAKHDWASLAQMQRHRDAETIR